MKIVQVGLGQFGASWLRDVLLPSGAFDEIIVVEPDNEKRERAAKEGGGCVVAAGLDEALSRNPGCLLNVTPPHIHRQVVEKALRAGIPVLCEKPVAHTAEDAMAMLQLAAEEGKGLMIAENYRYGPMPRALKKALDSGAIGRLSSVEIRFHRCHRIDNYHMDMEEPLLLDVAVHHADLLRYFTGQEVLSVAGRRFRPHGSWYKGNGAANLLFEMTGGITASYQGNLSSPVDEDSWNGTWRLEGETGVLLAEADGIRLLDGLGERRIPIEDRGDSRRLLLEEFLASLRENRQGETDIRDNIKSFVMMAMAVEKTKGGPL